MTEFDAVGKEIFQELYRSIVNVYYHQALATRWELLGWGVDAVSAVLILMGVVLAAWPWMGLKLPKVQREDLARHDEETRAITKKQLKWSLGTAAIGFVLLLLPFKSYSQENKDLVAAWSENRNRVDALESRFYQLDKTKNVPPEIKAEILAIRQAGTTLIGKETWIADPCLLKKCKGDTIAQFYGDNVRTIEAANEEFLNRKKSGLPPLLGPRPDQLPKK